MKAHHDGGDLAACALPDTAQVTGVDGRRNPMNLLYGDDPPLDASAVLDQFDTHAGLAIAGMAVLDERGTILAADDLFTRTAGSGSGDPAGQTLAHALRAEPAEALAAALAAGGSVTVALPGPDGPRPAMLDVSPLPVPLGSGVMVARLRLACESDQALAAMSEPLAARDIVALLRQEVRTPLTSIRGYAELIADRLEDPEEMAELASVILAEAGHLATLLDELALLERITCREVDLQMDMIDVNSVVSDAARRLEPDAHGIEIVLELEQHLPAIPADRDALLLMVTGLLRESLRVSPAGSTVRLQTSHLRQNLHLSVSDTGYPIADDDRERIFELFHRLDGRAARRMGGSGLALPVARAIARLHGGSIWAESGGEAGATLRLVLPLTGGQTVQAAD
jgi:signal transduction histidine kinase